MNNKVKSSLLIWCGALWDIAEKSGELHTANQVEQVRVNIEKLCGEVPQHQSEYPSSKEKTLLWKFIP